MSFSSFNYILILCSEASICDVLFSNLRRDMQNRPLVRPRYILSLACPGHLSDELLAAFTGSAQQGT